MSRYTVSSLDWKQHFQSKSVRRTWRSFWKNFNFNLEYGPLAHTHTHNWNSKKAFLWYTHTQVTFALRNLFYFFFFVVVKYRISFESRCSVASAAIWRSALNEHESACIFCTIPFSRRIDNVNKSFFQHI